MKQIFKIQNLESGNFIFCLKSDLEYAVNLIEAEIRTDYMNYAALTPHQAATPDELAAMEDKVSDCLEVNKYENETDLIEDLNRLSVR